MPPRPPREPKGRLQRKACRSAAAIAHVKDGKDGVRPKRTQRGDRTNTGGPGRHLRQARETKGRPLRQGASQIRPPTGSMERPLDPQAGFAHMDPEVQEASWCPAYATSSSRLKSARCTRSRLKSARRTRLSGVSPFYVSSSYFHQDPGATDPFPAYHEAPTSPPLRRLATEVSLEAFHQSLVAVQLVRVQAVRAQPARSPHPLEPHPLEPSRWTERDKGGSRRHLRDRRDEGTEEQRIDPGLRAPSGSPGGRGEPGSAVHPGCRSSAGEQTPGGARSQAAEAPKLNDSAFLDLAESSALSRVKDLS